MASQSIASAEIQRRKGRVLEHITQYSFDAMILLDEALRIRLFNTAADEVIITVKPQLLAMMGLQDFLKTVGKIRSRINNRLSVEGILLTMLSVLKKIPSKQPKHSNKQMPCDFKFSWENRYNNEIMV